MRLIEHFFSILAPNSCLGCSSEGNILCTWCMESSLPDKIERCYRCNRLSAQSATCAACRRNTPIKHLYVRTEYSDIARSLVHNMKFKYSGEAADLIARELMNTIPALPPNTIVVHVPTASTHVRRRGFDHAERKARVLAGLIGLTHVPALGRITQSRQVGSTRKVRLAQMDDAFRVTKPYIINNASVLLVDDVLTTGSTLEAAARTLKASGAKTIDAVVFAQAK